MGGVNRIVPFGGNEYQYYSTISELNIINGNLNLIHMNIKTLSSNLDEFLGDLKTVSKDFHVIVLTETYLKSENDWTDIPGFNAFHLIRTKKIVGGCTIVFDSSLECSLLPNLCIKSDFL